MMNDPVRVWSITALPEAFIIPVGALLILLGLLLFPVNPGLIPFSPDGQPGLLLVIEIVFAAMGIFSCIVPGILTDVIRPLLALLNIAGGVILLTKRFLPMLQGAGDSVAEPASLPPILKRLLVTLTVLNVMVIAFGISMLLPGLAPGMVIAGIVVTNGLLLFTLAPILVKIG